MRPLNDYFENLLSFAACLATVDGERQRVGKGRGLEGWKVRGLEDSKNEGFKDSRIRKTKDSRIRGFKWRKTED